MARKKATGRKKSPTRKKSPARKKTVRRKKASKKATRYYAAAGARINDDVAREVAHIAHDVGMSNADDFVEYVRTRPRLLVHSHFDWDDSEAAKKWRRQQAQNFMLSVRIGTVDQEDLRPEHRDVVHAFYNIRDDAEPRYEHYDVVRHNARMAEQVVARAKRDFSRMERRYRKFEDHFGGLLANVREFVNS